MPLDKALKRKLIRRMRRFPAADEWDVCDKWDQLRSLWFRSERPWVTKSAKRRGLSSSFEPRQPLPCLWNQAEHSDSGVAL